MPLSGRMATILKVVAGVLVVLLVVFLGGGVYLYRLSLTLPDIGSDPRAVETAQTSIVYAADGSELAQWHGEEDRTVVAIEAMPQELRDAVVAVEDERFYTHNGVDVQAITQALRASAGEGEASRGGSTITQQLVKILFNDGERTFTRKVREALLAYELEARTDKDQVLETYLNTVYFGHGAYGVERAARTYFGVGASELDLTQCATLAGVIRSPSRYSPIDAPDAARERRDLVLTKMRENGYVDETKEREAREAELVIAAPADAPEKAPYFVEYVKKELIERLGADAVFMGGLRVHTTLDPKLQAQAESAVGSVLGEESDPETALVAVAYDTGAVVAMVGGRDFTRNQFNLAVQGKRQPGSAFKPFVLVRALEEGVRPDQVFSAQPYSVKVEDGVWNVQNYENQFTESSLTLSAATNWSVNCVYARLMMQVGPEDVVDAAQRMGITTPLEPHPAIALGGLTTGVSPLEMASAYGTIASGGMRVAPTGIARVLDGNDDVVYEPADTPQRAISEEVAVQASLMLHDVVENGTGTNARIPGVWVAGKTGTTQSYRDAWFVGYAQDLSCAVWVGYREGQVEMNNVRGTQVTGGSFPATIWRGFMSQAQSYGDAPLTPNTNPAPDGESLAGESELVSICPETMQLANGRCPNPVEMYLSPSLIPKTTCTLH